ncbi:peroxidase family protein [Sorangium cellulosum]|uniref:Peroxidase n=1 Tax=Sorangium cellulosum So0157-2 TaxID=1254432 RepID=S4XVM9_SORCE|nr:peroxidase family protein [Sorangium cellulosum]AGP37302.1 hypothetical protein SCE1572_24145 [Sorangium cellulosum So0157-2]
MRKIPARILEIAFDAINLVVPWHRLPAQIGVFNLLSFRNVLRQKNLVDTREIPSNGAATAPPCFRPEVLYQRTADGSFNDLGDPDMGRAKTRFGRNVPLRNTEPEPEPRLLEPSPRLVSTRLLARRQFVPATSLNLLAAAWIQFMTRDWFNHGSPVEGNEFRVPLDRERGDDWPEDPMMIRRTPADPTRVPGGGDGPPTYVNYASHWWDGSLIYGSSPEELESVRDEDRQGSGRGKLKMMRFDGQQVGFISPATRTQADVSNAWWVGLTLIHTLFVKEHNAIVDRLRQSYPDWDGDRLFHTARLINTALLAKIHTVEWTTAILGHPALQIAMNANWWGLATERITRVVGRLSGSEVLSGIPGSKPEHHAAPYAMTEEFVAVYRMHSLMPEEIRLARVADGTFARSVTIPEVSGRRTGDAVKGGLSLADLLYSFGIAHPGAMVLHNYPSFLRNLERDDGTRIDLAAIDVMRDRERGVPRYNEFRALLHLGPVDSFEAMTSNKEWARELREVYGDVSRVDLMTGMLSEDLPAGFGFSDTAFRIFILMASRRIKSDRFLTTDFNSRIYTPEGMAWLNDSDMSSVLLRHHPELTPALRGVKNAFAPWSRLDGRPGRCAASQEQPPSKRRA